MICGSQDGSARLCQLQTKRVLATLSHDGNEARAGTINSEVQATENSVEWWVNFDDTFFSFSHSTYDFVML